ncbi:hypothetical protein [Leptospira saintgironsiae]|uniref:Uncharacterized protein n=1 Tax=Leptospira saintgironsiae TaxID=2023183 RepID=A0A2M9YBH2_9LEPT|nr:hypothetical protein [Leptospira saintgironsiae]PJZ48786.1 hypothetical protein CH362_13580 [Leptospira saintgironsiae]
MPSKIKINDDLWIFTKNNKFVIGSKRFPQDVHLTFNYGGHSGIFDLHFKNERRGIYASIALLDSKISDEILTIVAYKVKEFLTSQFEEISLNEFRNKYRYFVEDDNTWEFSEKEKRDIESIFEIKTNNREIRLKIPKRLDRSKLLKLDKLMHTRVKKTKRQNILDKSQGRVIDKFGRLSFFMILDGKVLVGKESIFEDENRLFSEILGKELFDKLKQKFIECLNHVSNEEVRENLFKPIIIGIQSN